MMAWLMDRRKDALYRTRGSPWENGWTAESFNSKLRDEFLNGELFYSLKEVQVLAERWRVHHNTISSGTLFASAAVSPSTGGDVGNPKVKTEIGVAESKVRLPTSTPGTATRYLQKSMRHTQYAPTGTKIEGALHLMHRTISTCLISELKSVERQRAH